MMWQKTLKTLPFMLKVDILSGSKAKVLSMMFCENCLLSTVSQDKSIMDSVFEFNSISDCKLIAKGFLLLKM